MNELSKYLKNDVLEDIDDSVYAMEPIEFADYVSKNIFSCMDFKEFFVKIMRYSMRANSNQICAVINLLKDPFLQIRFGVYPIIYLEECLMITCAWYKERKYSSVSEKDYQKAIIEKFDTIFPNYSFIKEEHQVPGLGRIDIYAEEKGTGRPVIIELKMGKKNPSKQLIAYGSSFKNPILIGVTEFKLNEVEMIEGITYTTYKDLKVFVGDVYEKEL